MRFLEITHAPNHVEDRGRNEQQAGDQAAQDRLRIPEDRAECADGARSQHRRVVFLLRYQEKEQHADQQTGKPIPIQNVPGSPRPISGPTTNCPAEPPAMPNICVAPIRVAACEAGKFLVAI